MSLLGDVDHLYEWAVMDPATLSDQALSDWSDAVASGNQMDKEGAKYVRRCMNTSRKLAAFWSSRPGIDDDTNDWRSRVDLSFGARAWRPQLDLAQHLLEISADEETYERVVELFRIVHNEPFLDGVSYSDWSETRQG